MVDLKSDNIMELEQTLKRLQGVARNRDITAVFRKASQPLVRAGKAQAPMGKKTKVTSRGMTKRGTLGLINIHQPGNLRRSIKFKTSKEYKQIWYVVPDRGRSAKHDAFYAHMVGGGTKHSKANPFMQRAFSQVGDRVMDDTFLGITKLTDRIWNNGK